MKIIVLIIVACVITSYCDGLKLKNNGYEDLYIVLQDSIKENDELVERIKVIFQNASALLYRATKHRAYFKSIIINVPKSWTKKEGYRTVSALSSSTSHIRIGKRNQRTPITVGSNRCGEKGLYTYLHYKHFILKEGLTSWGRHDAVVVHEWGHLRWGLKDEYPTIRRGTKDTWQFYHAKGKWNPVGCTRNIQGYASKTCKYGEADGKCDVNNIYNVIGRKCKFCPDLTQTLDTSIMAFQYIPTVFEFCDKDDADTPARIRHNSEALNEQNMYCNGRSAWEVMREHEDFRNGNNPPLDDEYPPQTEFIMAQETSDKVRILVLDTSGSMAGAKINALYHASKLMIESYLPEGSWMSIVDFDSSAKILSEFVQIDSNNTRQTLVSKLPRVGSGGTCIPCGTDLALQILRSFQVIDSTEQAEIILISDGQNVGGSMENATRNLVNAKVVVHSIAVTQAADQRLVDISRETGGRCFAYSEKGGSVSLANILSEIIFGGSASGSSAATMLSGEFISTRDTPTIIDFSIDDGIGKDTTVSIMAIYSTDLEVNLFGPDNFTVTESRANIQSLSVFVKDVIKPGSYRLKISSSASSNIEVIVTSRSTSDDAEIIRPIVALSTDQLDFMANKALPVMNVYLRKGESPVKNANVTGVIHGPSGAQTCEISFLDNGIEPDVQPGDGIYSAYIHRGCQENNGRHNSKVIITGNDETVVTLYSSSEAATTDDESDETVDVATGNFERVAVPDAFTVVNYDPVTASQDITPPARITDVEMIDIQSGIPSTSRTRNYTITWTATGDDMNIGQALKYEMRVAPNLTMLRNDFTVAEKLNVSGASMAPNVSGKVERLMMVVRSDEAFTSTVFFALVAIDDVGNRGPVSNIIPITVGSTSVYEVIKEDCTDNCYAVVTDCGRSFTISNGHIDFNNTETTPGNVVTVTCDVGYDLVGGSSIECRDDGTWTDTVSCQKHDANKILTNSLSTPIIIGISVACSFLVIVGIIFLVYRRRSMQRVKKYGVEEVQQGMKVIVQTVSNYDNIEGDKK